MNEGRSPGLWHHPELLEKVGLMAEPLTMDPIIRYPGSKSRIAPWIVSHFPPHLAYVEPFFGSGTVLFAKPRSGSEIVNDLDGEITNLFRVLRDQPEELARVIALTPWSREEFRTSFDRKNRDELEWARRFLTYWWQALGCRGITATGFCVDYCGKGKPARSVTWIGLPERLLTVARRLQGVQIENRPALELIARCQDKGVLIYCDPPYLGATRQGKLYAYEMREESEHQEMLAALLAHPGPVLISGYDNSLYEEHLPGWRKVQRTATCQKPEKRVESLWLNNAAVAASKQLVLEGF